MNLNWIFECYLPGVGDLAAGKADICAEDAGLLVVEQVAVDQQPLAVELDLSAGVLSTLGVEAELDGLCNTPTPTP